MKILVSMRFCFLFLIVSLFVFVACSLDRTAVDSQKSTDNGVSKAQATGPVKIQTFQSGATLQNQIYERITIVNTGTSAVALSTVKIRYYIAYQGSTSYNFACDYIPVGNGNVQNVFTAMSPTNAGAEAYQEISFTSGAGNLAAGASVEIQGRIWKSDWSTIDNTKNYSYNPSTTYVDWNKVTLYISGTLSWGIEPGTVTTSSAASVVSSIAVSSISSIASSIAASSSRSSVASSIAASSSRSSVASSIAASSSRSSVASSIAASSSRSSVASSVAVSSSVASSTAASSSSGSSLAVYGTNYPIWNSQIVYNTPGMLVQYNQKMYEDQGYAYDLNPELNNGQYMAWLLVGTVPNGPMGEGPFIGSGNYDKYVLGAYIIYNDVWGTSATNSQTLTAYSYSNWYVVSTQPDTSGVKSYPNSGLSNVGKAISSLSSFTSTFDVTVPSTGNWEVAYDLWVPTEVMIWMYQNGNVSPIAAGWDSTGNPIPSATNVNVGGYTWNVYHGGNNVVSLVAVSSTDGSWAPMKITKGTVDIKAVLNWIVAQGWVSAGGTCGAMQFGFEISGTGGVPLTFTCNNFSMTAN